VVAGPPVTALADYHHVPGKDLNVTACNATITPDCLRALYKIGDYEADPAAGSLFGVCGYLEEYAKFDELQTFLDKYAAYAAGENFTYTLINGGLLTQNNASLDGKSPRLVQPCHSELRPMLQR
jgi:tripeptidyl-peptidase I